MTYTYESGCDKVPLRPGLWEESWPDITSVDGRTFQHLSNSHFPSTERSSFYPGYYDNMHTLFTILAKRGGVEMPEIPAYDAWGNEKTDMYAVYIDRRLGCKRYDDFNYWLKEAEPRLRSFPEQEVIPADEFTILIDKVIEETGLGAKLEQMRAEDAARKSQAPDLDINAIMRNMRDQLR